MYGISPRRPIRFSSSFDSGEQEHILGASLTPKRARKIANTTQWWKSLSDQLNGDEAGKISDDTDENIIQNEFDLEPTPEKQKSLFPTLRSRLKRSSTGWDNVKIDSFSDKQLSVSGNAHSSGKSVTEVSQTDMDSPKIKLNPLFGGSERPDSRSQSSPKLTPKSRKRKLFMVDEVKTRRSVRSLGQSSTEFPDWKSVRDVSGSRASNYSKSSKRLVMNDSIANSQTAPGNTLSKLQKSTVRSNSDLPPQTSITFKSTNVFDNKNLVDNSETPRDTNKSSQRKSTILVGESDDTPKNYDLARKYSSNSSIYTKLTNVLSTKKSVDNSQTPPKYTDKSTEHTAKILPEESNVSSPKMHVSRKGDTSSKIFSAKGSTIKNSVIDSQTLPEVTEKSTRRKSLRKRGRFTESHSNNIQPPRVAAVSPTESIDENLKDNDFLASPELVEPHKLEPIVIMKGGVSSKLLTSTPKTQVGPRMLKFSSSYDSNLTNSVHLSNVANSHVVRETNRTESLHPQSKREIHHEVTDPRTSKRMSSSSIRGVPSSMSRAFSISLDKTSESRNDLKTSAVENVAKEKNKSKNSLPDKVAQFQSLSNATDQSVLRNIDFPELEIVNALNLQSSNPSNFKTDEDRKQEDLRSSLIPVKPVSQQSLERRDITSGDISEKIALQFTSNRSNEKGESQSVSSSSDSFTKHIVINKANAKNTSLKNVSNRKAVREIHRKNLINEDQQRHTKVHSNVDKIDDIAVHPKNDVGLRGLRVQTSPSTRVSIHSKQIQKKVTNHIPRLKNQHIPDNFKKPREVQENNIEKLPNEKLNVLLYKLENMKKKNLKEMNKIKENMHQATLHHFGYDAIAKPVIPRKEKTKVVDPDKEAQKLAWTAAKKINGVVYKAPKKTPRARWITPKLLTFMTRKLEQKNSPISSKTLDFLLDLISTSVKDVIRLKTLKTDLIDKLKRELALNYIVDTNLDFFNFVEDYLPNEFRVKVVPCTVPLKKQSSVYFDPGSLYEQIL